MLRSPSASPYRRGLLVLAAFALTAGFRYLALGTGFPNDHFVYISGGWQMLFGEWPTRDWVDPGLPLMFAASSLGQAVFGPTLLAEAVLVSVAFGLGAAFTALAVLEVTGSFRLAIVASVLEVVIFPRTYGYPKVLVYAIAFYCFARYVNQPRVGRAVAMAFAVVFAFLFRHDHGLFLGVGSALTILLVDVESWRVRAKHLAVHVGVGVLLALPYLVYVQINGGIASYLRLALEFSRREASRQWHVWPAVFGDPEPLASALVYEFHAMPFIAVAVLLAWRHRAGFRRLAAEVLPTAVIAVMANYNFIRDPLNTRLPDAIVPAVMLGTWLLWRAPDAIRWRRATLIVSALGLVLFTASACVAGDIISNLDRSDLVDEWNHVPRLFAERTADFQSRFAPRQIPSRLTANLVPFFGYLDRCTTPSQRLLVGGYFVELPFYARRKFAAGQGYFGGSFGGAAGEDLALRRLRGQAVPFVVMPSEEEEGFASAFPLMDEYVKLRYVQMTEIPVSDEQVVKILVDSSMTPNGRDAETGWPCFR